jgi:putative transposase
VRWLNLPRRTRRRVPRRIRVPLIAAATPNTSWALDFMVDTLYDGRRFRTLNIIDESNREGMAIEIGTTLPSLRVIAVLEELIALRGAATSARRQRPGTDVAPRSPPGAKRAASIFATSRMETRLGVN